jgi:hypothetical protein
MHIPTIFEVIQRSPVTLQELMRGTGKTWVQVINTIEPLLATEVGCTQTTRNGEEGLYYYWR